MLKAFKERNRGWLRWVSYLLGSVLFVFLLFCGCFIWEDHIFEDAKRDSERDCRLVMESQLTPSQAIFRLNGYRDVYTFTDNQREGVDKTVLFSKDVPTVWLRAVSIDVEYIGEKPVSCEVSWFVGYL